MRTMPRQSALALAAILFICRIIPVQADVAKPRAEAGDAYHLILFGPTHPVFLRVQVQVDGEGLKGVRRAYAAQLVKQYDQNGDDLLDKAEAEKVPPLVKAANASETLSVSAGWVSVDRDPADDRVSVDELADWIGRVLGFPVSLSSRPLRLTQSIDLFDLIDTDHDGRLTIDEQARAAEALHKLDLDEDDAFTIEEVAPLQTQRMRAAAQNGQARGGSDQPLFLLSDQESLAAAASRLLQRYAPEAEEGTSLAPASLNLESDEIAPFDADRDGRLNESELTAMLASPPAHIELEAQLQRLKPGKPTLRLVFDRLHATDGNSNRRADKLILSADGVDIEWRVSAARHATSDNRNLFKSRFRSADRDKNGYIDEQEFGALSFSDVTFTQVDRNGNGMLLLDELLTYVDQESALSQSRVDLTVAHDGSSVFEILDANSDRRISLRELRNAVERLKSYDRDGNGEISSAELVGKFRTILELGKPAALRITSEMRADNASAAPIVNRKTDGPDWFQRMDRNRDGDVTRREFLGPIARFREIDRAGDGLISAEEATAIER